MPNEIDPRLLARLATNRTSRRRFIGGGAAAAAALALGPTVLAACGSDSGTSGDATTTQDAGPASGTLRISNWPLYMADGFVAEFQTASGITVDYKEDFNDNEEWFAKVKEPLSRKQDIGADLAVPTSVHGGSYLHSLGWLNDISDAGWSNKKNLRSDLLEAERRPRSTVQRAVHVGTWSGWPTTGRRPAVTSPRSTTCGIPRSRARSACSPMPQTRSA